VRRYVHLLNRGEYYEGYLLRTSTASRRLLNLRQVLHGVHDLNEGWGHLLTRSHGLRGLDHRGLHMLSGALAAWVFSLLGLLWLLGGTGRLITDELTLGSGTEGGLLALPVALSLLAHGGTLGLGGSTGSSALSRSTYGLTLGAVSSLTEVLRASNIALGLITVDLTSGTGCLLAVDLALRSLTYRVALGGASRIITLPSALRVTSSTTITTTKIHIQLHLIL